MKYGKWIKRYGIRIGLLSLIALEACSADPGELGNDQPEFKELPISFQLEHLGGQQSKATDNNDSDLHGIDSKLVRPVHVDHIRLNVFKREIGEEHFFLDANNSNVVLTCIEHEQFPYYRAYGKISIQKNHEYRLTAVGYSKKLGEDTLFVRNAERKRFDHARLELTDLKEYKTPEFFFGTPMFQGKEVFSYDDMEQYQGKAALEGWLYRGVAGIELNLGSMGIEVQKVELLADSIHAMVDINHYDNFLKPYEMKRDGQFQHYVLGVDSLQAGEEYFKNDSVHIVGASLLPVCTSLSLRITKKAVEGKPAEVLCARMQLFEYEKPASGLSSRSIPDDEGNGTGIIPDDPDLPENPENPDEGKNPYTVCFKRNNYYRINGDFSKLNTMQYVFHVVVNPNWDRTVNLSLQKE